MATLLIEEVEGTDLLDVAECHVFYRNAVSTRSPGLPLGATLGANCEFRRNPDGVVAASSS